MSRGSWTSGAITASAWRACCASELSVDGDTLRVERAFWHRGTLGLRASLTRAGLTLPLEVTGGVDNAFVPAGEMASGQAAGCPTRGIRCRSSLAASATLSCTTTSTPISVEDRRSGADSRSNVSVSTDDAGRVVLTPALYEPEDLVADRRA